MTVLESVTAWHKDILDQAPVTKKILHVFITEKPVNRIKGQNVILYIGQTEKQTSYHRYISDYKRDSQEFWERYVYLNSNFGPMSVGIKQVDDPKKEESYWLYRYHRDHHELPPINGSGYSLDRIKDLFQE